MIKFLLFHEPEAILIAANKIILTSLFDLTGLTVDTIRKAAGDPSFYTPVLDHSWLIRRC
ncbi:hypothetical protein AA309_13050 [Microvirga vignae]|uniref:Uncharacterized protein n=1 Tax=Microvirga vignae TaxID=1225564 RepID=A0A0H1RJ33_9HYPH|nr:hypothetical protein AA309_13050 [Microvirga vignae]